MSSLPASAMRTFGGVTLVSTASPWGLCSWRALATDGHALGPTALNPPGVESLLLKPPPATTVVTPVPLAQDTPPIVHLNFSASPAEPPLPPGIPWSTAYTVFDSP